MGEGTVNNPMMNRRIFLKTGLTGGISFLLTACGLRPDGLLPITNSTSPENPVSPIQKSEFMFPPTSELGVHFQFGKEETVASAIGLQWAPDGHIAMNTNADGVKSVWISANDSSYVMTGNSLESLGMPREVLKPTKTVNTEGEFEGYRTLTSVIGGKVPGVLYGFCHEEHWQSEHQEFPFKASISITTSRDNGVTWNENPITILRGMHEKSPSEGISGAGQPCAIEKDGFVYVYYVDWNAAYSDAIHVSRAPIDDIMNPDAWKKFDGNDFVQPGIRGVSVPVIQSESVYAALPSVSFNSSLNKLLTFVETDTGFAASYSEDGVRWTPPEEIAMFPTPHSQLRHNDTWYSYPTFLSETTHDTQTNASGFLYYAKGVQDGDAHKLYRRSVEIQTS